MSFVRAARPPDAPALATTAAHAALGYTLGPTRSSQAWAASAMPYSISLRDGGRYAVIEWTGAISKAGIEASGAALVARAAEQGFDRVLVDVSAITNRLSFSDLFYSTGANAKLGPPRLRAAILGRPDLEQDLRFIEDVAVNRGMPLKTFTREAEALTWLLA